MEIRGEVAKLNPWLKPKSSRLFITQNVYGLIREFVERLIRKLLFGGVKQ